MSLGLWKRANRAEGFQIAPAPAPAPASTPTLAELQTQAKAALAEFFPVWNSFPFAKPTTVSNSVNTVWAKYITASSPYISSEFTNLISTPYQNVKDFTIVIDYINKTKSTTLTISNIKLNDVVINNTYVDSIVPQTLVGYVAPSYGGVKTVTPTPYEACRKAGHRSDTSAWYMANNALGGVYNANCLDANYNTRIGAAVGYAAYYPGNPGTLVNGTGTIVKTISLEKPVTIWSVSFDNSVSNDSNLFLLKLNGYNMPVTILCYEKLIYDFNNSYVALLIDIYTNIVARHSTNPPTTYTAPTTAPTNAATDRSNAMAGTNIDTIKTSYLTDYLPTLYSSILTQTKAYLSNINGFYTDLLTTTQTTLNISADIATLNALPTTSTNITQDILTVTTIYAKYNYTTLTKEAAATAIQRFYRTSYIPYSRYLRNVDISASLITDISNARLYYGVAGTTATSSFNTLAANTSYSNIYTQMNSAFRSLISTLLRRLNTSYTTWTTYGMTSQYPSDFITYVSSGWSSDNDIVSNSATTMSDIVTIRDKLGTSYWPVLMQAIQSFTSSKVSLLSHAYTFATQQNTTPIALNALGTNAATVGLGQSAKPLVFTHPIVTGTGTTRAFYGIVLNTGLISGSLSSLGFVWGTTPNPTENSSTVSTTTTNTFSIAVSFPSTISSGTTIYVRTYASNSAFSDLVYGNEITFVY